MSKCKTEKYKKGTIIRKLLWIKINSIKSHKDWNASFGVRCSAISGVRSEIILHNTVLVTNGKIMMI